MPLVQGFESAYMHTKLNQILAPREKKFQEQVMIDVREEVGSSIAEKQNETFV